MPGGDGGTLGTTVPWMRQLIREGRASPAVRGHALSVIASAPDLHPAESLFRHVQAMPYVSDEAILARSGVGGETTELLQGPEYQVSRARLLGAGAVPGDCDDRTLLLQSMLESVGYQTRLVLVRGPGRADYSHVYGEVRLEDGSWLPLDTIMDGEGGRPFFRPGDEVGPPLARDRVSVPVDGLGAVEPGGARWLVLAAAAAIFLWRR